VKAVAPIYRMVEAAIRGLGLLAAAGFPLFVILLSKNGSRETEEEYAVRQPTPKYVQ
jgi:hypothetical protein